MPSLRPRLICPCFAVLVAGLLGVVRWAQADPTAQEQYWLELVNLARRDPAGELERLVNFSSPTTFGSPASDNPDVAAALAYYGTDAATLSAQWTSLAAAPALAWNDNLRASAVAYSGIMISMDQQSHLLTGTGTVQDRVEQRIHDGGYFSSLSSPEYLDLGENLYASAKSVVHGHSGFLIDWGDSDTNSGNGFGTGIQTPATHRELLFDKYFKEIGIGTVTSGIPVTNSIATGPIVVTQHLGNHWRNTGTQFVVDAILTGVVYFDTVQQNDFYTPGEGLVGALIEVYDNLTNSLLFAEATNSAGGFNISLPGVETGDVLRVVAPGLGLPDQLYTVSGFTEPATTYGQPVTFFDNVHASFQLVPEPGSALLASVLLLYGFRRRRGIQLQIQQNSSWRHPSGCV